MKSPIDTVRLESSTDVDGASASIAGESVVVSRKDVTKENTFKKFLVMLANTLLSVKTVVHEDLDYGQINISNGGSSLLPQVITTANPNRSSVFVRNIGGKNLYIGDQNVTISTGFLLKSSDAVPVQLHVWGSVYGICDDAAGTIAAFIEE